MGNYRRSHFCFLYLKFFKIKMHIVGASSPTFILGSFDHSLEQKRAMGPPPKQNMSKWSVLQNEWSAVLCGAAILMLSCGNPGSPAARLLKLPVSSETGNGLALCVQRVREETSNDPSKAQDSCTWENVLFVRFRTESTLINFEEKAREILALNYAWVMLHLFRGHVSLC